jgi:uncharacterized membrane protein YgdD (TMEM256/DUF423 family)
MESRQHSILGEGLLTGLIGGLVVAIWYFLVDLGRGQPLHTPNVLGQVFVGRDTTPGVHVMPQAVAEYSLLHFAVFLVLGIVLVWLAHLSTKNPSLRMGVWLGLVIGFLLFIGHLLMLYSLTDQRFPWWTALGGSILGMGSMAWFLWRRHPSLRGTFDDADLGSEVKAPPHPPGPARGDSVSRRSGIR